MYDVEERNIFFKFTHGWLLPPMIKMKNFIS